MEFASAYRQLTPLERGFVDDFLRTLEAEAARRWERLPVTLARVVKALDVTRLDERTRAYFERQLVQAAINERVAELSAQRDLTAEWIIRQYQNIASFSLEKCFSVNKAGFPEADLSGLSSQDWQCLAEVATTENDTQWGTNRTLKFKAHDKMRALDKLAQLTGLDKTEHADYLAYKATPAELVKLSQSAGLQEAGEYYAKFIG